MFKKILIANRGEIACRVIRTADVQAIFGPGTNLADAADEVLRLLGHNHPPLDEAAE
jgi:methylmalonyl-CoA mutase